MENKGLMNELIGKRMKIPISDHLAKLRESINQISEKLELLTKEEDFGETQVVDIYKVLKKVKSTTRYSVKLSIDQEFIKSTQLNVRIAKKDFEEVISHIITNAVKHGVVEENKDYVIRIHITYESDTDMYVIQISNNGKPMPKGMDNKRYIIRGEYAGENGNEGIGGYRVNSIIEHFKGELFVENDPNDSFPVKITIKLPKAE